MLEPPRCGLCELAPPEASDPVLEAYKKDVDRTLLIENLKLSPAQRAEKFQDFMKFLEEIRHATLSIYARARDYAQSRGILLADTKFEFGVKDGALLWVDEALTPDSSRFWPADGYQPGRSQPSFDKQFVRDYLETLSWDKRPPGPVLPDEVVAKTRAKYREAFERLTAGA